MALEFEWDPFKSRLNEKRHGVSFKEGMTAFADKLSYTIADPEHFMGEYRFLHLGLSTSGSLLVISHTERGDRIISARRATKREREQYAQGQL